MIGKFLVYCNNCGHATTSEDVWRGGHHYMVCGKYCHDEIEMKYARAILGKDTLTDEQISECKIPTEGRK